MSTLTEFQRILPVIRIVELMLTCERIFYIVVKDHINVSATKPNFRNRFQTNHPLGMLSSGAF